ncbi:MAG: exopolysaccharide biosynthesis protein [Rickettsiales bacterium]
MVSKGVPASQLFNELVNKAKAKKDISFGEINEHLSERGFAILMILFAIPVMVPIPGLSTVLGLPLIVFAMQMAMGMEKPFLPKWLSQKKISSAHLIYSIEKSNKYFIKIEKFLHPRLSYFNSSSGEKIIGIISLICSITISLPIWGGNALPSLGILIMSFGLLGKDGVAVIIGIIVSIIGLFTAYFIVFLFIYGAQMASDSVLKDIYHYIIEYIGIDKLFKD